MVFNLSVMTIFGSSTVSGERAAMGMGEEGEISSRFSSSMEVWMNDWRKFWVKPWYVSLMPEMAFLERDPIFSSTENEILLRVTYNSGPSWNWRWSCWKLGVVGDKQQETQFVKGTYRNSSVFHLHQPLPSTNSRNEWSWSATTEIRI